MKMESLVEQFVEDLSFEALIAWADTLSVPHTEKHWLDDEYPDKESELRVNVIDAIIDLGRRL